jgi:hypothetical protein
MACGAPAEVAAEFTRFAPVFGDLADEPRLVASLASALEVLHSRGVADALRSFTS